MLEIYWKILKKWVIVNEFLTYGDSKNKIEVELDLSNYATKYDLKTQQVLIYQSLLKRLI